MEFCNLGGNLSGFRVDKRNQGGLYRLRYKNIGVHGTVDSPHPQADLCAGSYEAVSTKKYGCPFFPGGCVPSYTVGTSLLDEAIGRME